MDNALTLCIIVKDGYTLSNVENLCRQALLDYFKLGNIKIGEPVILQNALAYMTSNVEGVDISFANVGESPVITPTNAHTVVTLTSFNLTLKMASKSMLLTNQYDTYTYKGLTV